MHGIFISYGEDIKKGYNIDKIKIYDLAPTILHIFNVPLPADVDGRVLKEMFVETSDIYKREIKIMESEKYRIKRIIAKIKK